MSTKVIRSDSDAAVGKERSKREKWSKSFDFLFNAAGAMVGLGNIWRFPYLCFTSGGGAFLIPYVFFLVVIAVPVFTLETALGQMTGVGSTRAWNVFPLLRGIGFASATILAYCNCYYPMVIVWSVRYLVASFNQVLEWTHCNNDWNTDKCFGLEPGNASCGENCNETKSSVLEFWEIRVLNKSPGIDVPGYVQWDLLLCLVATWILIYFSIWKGVKWTAKIIYFTATVPILMVIVLAIRGFTLEGASMGISFYLKPDLAKIWDVKVWLSAASQVLYSYGLCYGAVVNLGSYNKIRHNFLRDSMLMLLFNSGSSFLCGFAVFSTLGSMATLQNTTVEKVAEAGPGLVFIAYPQALSLLPLPQLWCVIFFITIFLLGIDGQFVFCESLTAAIMDLMPSIRARKNRQQLFVALTCGVFCLVSVIFVAQNGIYVFNLFDNFSAAGWCAFSLCILECGAAGWIGGRQFLECLFQMLGKRSKLLYVIRFFWMFVSPSILIVIVIANLVLYEPLTYNKTYVYPVWAQAIGWLMTLSSFIFVPAFAIYMLIKTDGSLKTRLVKLTKMPDHYIEGLRMKLADEKELKNIKSLLEDDDSKT